jgi:glycyl-tRNA synthetase
MVSMEKIVSLCKRRGFIFPGSEIYGGLASTWDYGPLGVELKRNTKKAWWRVNVWERDDIYGLDAAILMRSKVWEASGHTQSFKDSFVKCSTCSKYFRREQICELTGRATSSTKEEVKITCPNCGSFLSKETTTAQLMLETSVGPVEETAEKVYLRPETAQGIFVNFANVLDVMHPKLPFGIAQIGKAFRNEITTGNFTFRSHEFEQMEIEYFVKPGTDEEAYLYWIRERLEWYVKLGIKKENLRTREHNKNELSHYAKSCTDIEYLFPFGWAELEGIAKHSKFSTKELTYFDEENQKHILPYIIEPSAGVDRAILAFLVDAYREEKVKGKKRVVLGLSRKLAPIKVAILPLLRNQDKLVALAKKIREELKDYFHTVYDDTGSIGRLYRRQDEIGTPYCVTVDVKSLEDKAVTVRDRDTMKQERISLYRLKDYLVERLATGGE